MRTISGLTDEQVLAFEARAEAAMLVALQRVMDVIADRIGAIQTASAYAGTYSRIRVLVAANGEDMDEDDGLPPGQSYVSPDDLASIPPLWAEAAGELLLPLAAEVFLDSAGTTHANMVDATNISALPSVGSLAAEQYLAQARNTFAEVGDELWGNARDQLQEGFEQGESIPELAQRLRDSAGITGRKAVLVARTQVIEASNAGSFATAQASGLEMKKEWFATPDPRTRPTHKAADGQQAPLNEPFVVGGFEAMFPAAPTLPPSERYSCRCAIGFVMAEAQVKQGQRDAIPVAPLPGTSGVDEPQSPIATETDPALKMTVADIKAAARNAGVPIEGTRKADILANLRQWEIGNAKRIPGLPEWRAPVIRPGAIEAPPLGVPSPSGPVLSGTRANWADGLTGDTSPEGVRVRDLRVLPEAQDGSFPEYVVDTGTAWRIDGISYLIEHGPDDFGAPWVSRALVGLQEAHKAIPAALKANKSYAVLSHANPADEYWRRKFNNPSHTSHMSAARGNVTVYGFSSRDRIADSVDSLRHESGHNVDDLIGRQTKGSQSPEWKAAATSDARVVSRIHLEPRTTSQLSIAPVTDAARDFPHGVSRYGQSSAVEDFAESTKFYQSGPIARGRLVPDGDVVDLYFRDLYPARAKILDAEFPDIATTQRAEIAAARAPKVSPIAVGAPGYVARQGALRAVSRGQPSRTTPLEGGIRAESDRLDYPDGTRVVRKDYGTRDPVSARLASDAEELAAQVLDAVGVRVPAVVRLDSHTTLAEFVDGAQGGPSGVLTAPAELKASQEGRLLGLGDALIGNRDRNLGNWLRTPEGRLVAIDNGDAFEHGERAAAGNPFTSYLMSQGSWAREITLPDGVDLKDLRARVVALRPEFVRLDHGRWHDDILGRLDEIERRALPVKAVVPAPDLSKLPIARLRAMAKERGITVPAGTRKADLVKLLGKGPASFESRVAAAVKGVDAVRAVTPLDWADRSAIVEAVGEDAYEALRTYRGITFGRIQDDLRGGFVPPETAGLDRIMGASRLTGDVVTYRGMQSGRGVFGDRLDGDLTGATWTEQAYVSTSANDVARIFANRRDDVPGMFMRVLTPRGTGAVSISGGEAELLLQRGLTLRVVADHGVEQFGKFRHRVLDVEVVPAGKAAAEGKALRAAARETNRLIEARAGMAKLLAEIDELIANKASKATILQRLDPALIEPEQIYAGTDPAVLDALRVAVQSGDPAKLRSALTRAGTSNKIKAIGKSGAKAKFDPDTMDAVGADIPDGADVVVVTRGSTLTLPDGKVVQLSKAQVRTALRPKPGLVRETDMRRVFKVNDKESALRTAPPHIEKVTEGPREGWARVITDIEHRVRESDGVHWYDAGNFTSEISPDGRSVWHSFGIDEEFQGQGFMSRHIGRLLEDYKRLGVERILLEADNEVGGYAWARAGFRFADEDARQEFVGWSLEWAKRNERIYGKGFVDEVRRVGLDPAVEPIDFAMIGHSDSTVSGVTGIRLWAGKRMMLGSTWRGVLDL